MNKIFTLLNGLLKGNYTLNLNIKENQESYGHN